MAPLSLTTLYSLVACVSLATFCQSHSLQKRALTNPGPPGWTSIGCYTDQAPRTLLTGMTANVPGGSAAMTIALCTSTCQTKNFLYAGAEYGQECWCGNAISNGGQPALSGCDKPCKGNTTENCGGSNRLNVYQFGVVSSTSSVAQSSTSSSGTTSSSISPPTTTLSTSDTISSTSTSSSTGSSTSSSASASASGLPSGWSYKGCFVDNANGRILLQGTPASTTQTIDKCVATCVAAGYTVAGAEFGNECFCGNAVVNGGSLATSDSQCSSNCGGNPAQKCGGASRMSVYATGNLTIYPVPKVQKTDLPGKWEYKGCLAEGPTKKIWKYQSILTKTNSATECLSRCSQFGFMAGGMEYGTECYCGDVVDIEINGGVVKPETDCKTTCPGDPRYLCGSGARLTWYEWSLTDPLYKWNYASGDAAGSYKFFVPGVVVPLITTVGVNGKITFVEKAGTGPPNSTGAFELDPSLAGDFSKAWRTMRGLKTDVFCSAGLTLPDKAGRQITIGGWSGTSTFGVRTYTPDGSPGTASVNNWEENAALVKLQKGRWYPSGMIMSNGSMLVVGGENGSNGAPVPSVEILPPTGPVIEMDWLQRTDPLNLYPFLFVLPGGGIFVGYYNEARILDPVTLETVRTLPQIPGNVNNPAAGRTYPLEGAAMMMPQKAPYTEPVTMLICGGSTTGAATATDNCVSIQPENPSSNWTIERMPSQRVMPCIAALPDGTYLIANGAQQGVAGFGLANTPNFNAVLYDPSKPVNERMTVLANTTVARLYHSEAILMQDGRVLISGSDPQSNKFPQEYRVEVFEPPYTTSGLPKPTFTIADKDWEYGSQYTITVTAGNTGDMRASLLGAVSSTHGNSMGQRTIFPAISCAGNTCTITAPPDAKVCPPGWFQLFILDGPTPSTSTWVRIGKDPAQLGNWPKATGFTLPGI